MFNIMYIKQNKFEEINLNKLILNHNIIDSEEYLQAKSAIEWFNYIFDYNDLPVMDELIYAKFINNKLGYGVFAK